MNNMTMNPAYTGVPTAQVSYKGMGVQSITETGDMRATMPLNMVEQIEPTSESKPYELRPLNARDIFPMTKIIRKIGLKDFGKCFEPEEIKAITETLTDKESVEDIAEVVGVSVVLKIVDIILEHLPDAGEEVFIFLAGLIGTTKEEVAVLPMDVFFDLIVDVFKRKEFVGFMKAVSRLVK